MNEKQLVGAIEAILFAIGKKISIEDIKKIINRVYEENISNKKIIKALNQLKDEYSNSHALKIFENNELWFMNVKDEYVEVVTNLTYEADLTKSVLETLSIIAWKAPALQSEIIEIRNSKAYDHIHLLEQRGFIKTEKFGNTKIIKLTDKFFDYFDIDSKIDLKTMFKEKLKDFEEKRKQKEEIRLNKQQKTLKIITEQDKKIKLEKTNLKEQTINKKSKDYDKKENNEKEEIIDIEKYLNEDNDNHELNNQKLNDLTKDTNENSSNKKDEEKKQKNNKINKNDNKIEANNNAEPLFFEANEKNTNKNEKAMTMQQEKTKELENKGIEIIPNNNTNKKEANYENQNNEINNNKSETIKSNKLIFNKNEENQNKNSITKHEKEIFESKENNEKQNTNKIEKINDIFDDLETDNEINEDKFFENIDNEAYEQVVKKYSDNVQDNDAKEIIEDAAEILRDDNEKIQEKNDEEK